MRDSQAAFTRMVDGYKAAVDAPGGGALLLAVLRGNLSEGVSLNGPYARFVGIIGLPFGPVGEPKLEAKKKFNNAHREELGSGEEFYKRLMCRAVNQALGRAIRSKDDYGAVVLIDERHEEGVDSKLDLPAWAGKFYRPDSSFNRSGSDGRADLIAQYELQPFFEAAARDAAERARAAAGPT